MLSSSASHHPDLPSGSSSDITIRELAQVPPVRAHLLPCKVHCKCSEEDSTCNHPAKVEMYFDPVIRGDPDKGYSATMRGRLLRGALLDVPEGCTGKVMKESMDTEVMQ